MITLKTNHGDITLSLDMENTPNTAKNFCQYAKDGFYNGTIFHRVIDGFMIQGGGFDTKFQQKKTNAPIENEGQNSQKNARGTVAMARTSDPHSATAQFFINVGDNHFLDYRTPTVDGWGYCVFGKVTSGMEVVDKIRQVATGAYQGHQDVPKEQVIIEEVLVEEDKGE